MVEIHFLGKFEDGKVFADSHDGEPLRFVAGSDEVMPGISRAVLGMKAGESSTVRLEPGEAYGEHQDGLAQTVPTEALPDDVKVGDQLAAHVGDRQVPVWVTELGDGKATVDANHPLAGRVVVFELQLEGVTPRID